MRAFRLGLWGLAVSAMAAACSGDDPSADPASSGASGAAGATNHPDAGEAGKGGGGGSSPTDAGTGGSSGDDSGIDGGKPPDGGGSGGASVGMRFHLLRPTGWSESNFYYWGTVPSAKQNIWPGEAMSPEQDGWSGFWLPGESAANFIFNGNPAPQTVDLYSDKPENWYVEGDLWDIDPSRFDCCTFPGARNKALVMSYDDGGTQDKQLVALLNSHGIKGSFNLDSGLIGNSDKVHADEIPVVYAGHEVAVHSVSHPHITESTTQQELEAEILADKVALEAIVGYPMRGMAYPFGDYSSLLLKLMPSWGLRYGRVVPATQDFRLPSNLLVWRGTSHHYDAMLYAEPFVSLDAQKLSVLQVWGHSWELDQNIPQNSWQHMSDLCSLLGGRSDVWYASAGDMADYLSAIRSLVYTSDGKVSNPSDVSVFYKRGGEVVEIPAHSSIDA